MKEHSHGRRDAASDYGPRKRLARVEDLDQVDYRDYELLRKFMTERGKILPRRFTGGTALQQRQIKRAIRRARVMGLLP